MTPEQENFFMQGRDAAHRRLLEHVLGLLGQGERDATAWAVERAEALAALADLAEELDVNDLGIDPKDHLADTLRRLRNSL